MRGISNYTYLTLKFKFAPNEQSGFVAFPVTLTYSSVSNMELLLRLPLGLPLGPGCRLLSGQLELLPSLSLCQKRRKQNIVPLVRPYVMFCGEAKLHRKK
jgi:hypothetical protein